MKKLVIIAISIALTATMTLPGVAAASEADAEHDVTVDGKGWLWAKGTGSAEINMGGVILLRVNGDVTFTDNAGNLRVHIRHTFTDRQALPTRADVVLNDFRGLVVATGSDFTVEAEGTVKLKAHGRGEAFLVGDGVYRTRHGKRHVWDGMATEIGPDVSSDTTS